MSEVVLDSITMAISYTLFWVIIIILILYPKLRIRKLKKRINKLERKQIA
ncbi:MAG: hypothetical protein ACFFKA_20385 [Candidatus Thorarchaeota archaeon]